jgi:hypothetical protein
MKVSGNNSLLNFSRTILFASSGKDFAEKAKEEAEKILGEMIKN